MLADNLNRIVAQLSKNFVRVLREANPKELLALVPSLRKAADVKPQRAAKKAPAKAEKPARKARSAKADKPGKPAKRGAGSLTRQILSLLKIRREGFRSEEIQRRLKADPEDLRETLANLLQAKRIERHGQARGTRYCLPSGDSDAPASSEAPSAFEAPSPARAPEAPPVHVSEAMIDQVRLVLSNSGTPVPHKELQAQLSSFSSDQLKATLDRMVTDGLIDKIRSGPTSKYELNSHKTTDAAPRVIKKRPHDGDHAEGAEEKIEEEKPADPAGT